MKQFQSISFASDQRDFSTTMNKRVNSYFKDHNVSRLANREMVIKTFVMFSLYLIPFGLIVTQTVTSMLAAIACVVVMGLGFAGIGLSVMHDANHGAYSNKQWINTMIGYSLNLIGANAFNWKMQHNVLHHSFTNVHDVDEDISPRGALRFTPNGKWKPMHRYQFIYAWFLYGLMTIVWLIHKDFERTIKYFRNGLMKKHQINVVREWVILITTKIIYVGYIFVLPLMTTSFLWWQIFLGILMMHYIGGFILAVIFQPAHLTESADFPMPDADLKLENNWTIHQLRTTSNYANKSRWFSWYVGGLNFQVEHHLFPNICHVHYRHISSIVESTALEYGIPYNTIPTFAQALGSHQRMLVKLGAKPANLVAAS